MLRPKDCVIPIFLLATLLRFQFFSFTDNFYWAGDLHARLQIAYGMLDTFRFMPTIDWLPGHFYFLWSNFLISDNTVDFPRLANMVVSVALMFPIFKVSLIWSKNETTALLSIFLYAIAFPFIVYSTITQADLFNSSLCICAVYLFVQYEERKKTSLYLLFLCSIFFALANFTKYESWLISFATGLYLLSTRPKLKHVFCYGLITSAPILYVFYFHHETTGDFLRGLHYSDFEVSGINKLSPMTIGTQFQRIHFMFPFFGLILGFPYAIYLALRKRNFLPVLTSATLSCTLYKLFISASLLAEPRYFMFSSFLCVIFIADLIRKLVAHESLSRRLKLVSLAILCISSSWCTYLSLNVLANENNFNFKVGYLRSANWFRSQNLPDKHSLFIDKDYSWSFQAWTVYAGIPDFANRGGCSYHDRPWDNDRSTLDDIIKCITSQKIQYMLIFNDSKLLKLLPDHTKFDDIFRTKTLFEHNDFRVLRIEKVL